MLLSDTDIRARLQSTDPDIHIGIEPLNQQDIQPGSIDLHLGPKLLVASPRWSGFMEMTMTEESGRWIEPEWFVLAETLEKITIPPTLAGEMVGKSSRAREGWVIEAAGYFDPGWIGVGTLELSLRYPQRRLLTLGLPIAQMRFHVLSSHPQFLYGQKELRSHYFAAAGVEPSYQDRSLVWGGPLPQPTEAPPAASPSHNPEPSHSGTVRFE